MSVTDFELRVVGGEDGGGGWGSFVLLVLPAFFPFVMSLFLPEIKRRVGERPTGPLHLMR